MCAWDLYSHGTHHTWKVPLDKSAHSMSPSTRIANVTCSLSKGCPQVATECSWDELTEVPLWQGLALIIVREGRGGEGAGGEGRGRGGEGGKRGRERGGLNLDLDFDLDLDLVADLKAYRTPAGSTMASPTSAYWPAMPYEMHIPRPRWTSPAHDRGRLQVHGGAGPCPARPAGRSWYPPAHQMGLDRAPPPLGHTSADAPPGEGAIRMGSITTGVPSATHSELR